MTMRRKFINWNLYSYTEEELRKAVSENISKRASLLALGLEAQGGGYKTIQRMIDVLNLDTSHWLGKGYLRGKSHNFNKKSKIPLKDILVENSTYDRGRLKWKLIKENLLTYECFVCKLVDWLGQPIILRLDHINGINDDNRLENLRLMCPNCDSQSSTFCGRNTTKAKKNKEEDKLQLETDNSTIKRLTRPKKLVKVKKIHICLSCPAVVKNERTRCNSCAAKIKVKINWPPTKELIQMVKDSSYLAVGRQLGISDNAIRNRIYRHPDD